MPAVLRIEIDDENTQEPLSFRGPCGPGPASLVVGKTSVQAMTTLPLLFNLCPSAHRLAAAMAMDLTIDTNWPRQLLSDDLREQAMVILCDWPVSLGEVPDMGALRGLFRLEADRLTVLKQSLQSMGNRMISVVSNWDETWGYWDSLTLVERMHRRLDHALSLCDRLSQDQCGGHYGSEAAGEGWALAARGRLVHRVTLSNGCIAAYSIETPTERMIRDGSLKGLLTSAWRSSASVRTKVFDLALTCADPCVPIRITNVLDDRMKGGAHA